MDSENGILTALDATFRDGGYYNNWNFDIDLANEYLKVMEISKINAVEIGFRSPSRKDIGLFANVTDFFIEDKLYIPKIDYFGVMINSSEFDYDLANELFVYCDRSPINLVRSATHFSKVDSAEIILKYIKFLVMSFLTRKPSLYGRKSRGLVNLLRD